MPFSLATANVLMLVAGGLVWVNVRERQWFLSEQHVKWNQWIRIYGWPVTICYGEKVQLNPDGTLIVLETTSDGNPWTIRALNWNWKALMIDLGFSLGVLTIHTRFDFW